MLHVAVGKQNIRAREFLLRRYGNAVVDKVDRRGSTPLLNAVILLRKAKGDFEKESAQKVVERLQRASVDCEVRPATSYPFGRERLAYHMCEAAARGRDDVIKAVAAAFDISELADYDGRSPLHLACCEGQVEVIRTLLEVAAHGWAADGAARAWKRLL